MSDRRTEWACIRFVAIEVYPLAIFSDVGKTIDALLADFHPIGNTDLFADELVEIVQ